MCRLEIKKDVETYVVDKCPYDAADDFDSDKICVMLTVVHRIDGTILIVIVFVAIMTTVHLIKRTM